MSKIHLLGCSIGFAWQWNRGFVFEKCLKDFRSKIDVHDFFSTWLFSFLCRILLITVQSIFENFFNVFCKFLVIIVQSVHQCIHSLFVLNLIIFSSIYMRRFVFCTLKQKNECQFYRFDYYICINRSMTIMKMLILTRFTTLTEIFGCRKKIILRQILITNLKKIATNISHFLGVNLRNICRKPKESLLITFPVK